MYVATLQINSYSDYILYSFNWVAAFPSDHLVNEKFVKQSLFDDYPKCHFDVTCSHYCILLDYRCSITNQGSRAHVFLGLFGLRGGTSSTGLIPSARG